MNEFLHTHGELANGTALSHALGLKVVFGEGIPPSHEFPPTDDPILVDVKILIHLNGQFLEMLLQRLVLQQDRQH